MLTRKQMLKSCDLLRISSSKIKMAKESFLEFRPGISKFHKLLLKSLSKIALCAALGLIPGSLCAFPTQVLAIPRIEALNRFNSLIIYAMTDQDNNLILLDDENNKKRFFVFNDFNQAKDALEKLKGNDPLKEYMRITPFPLGQMILKGEALEQRLQTTLTMQFISQQSELDKAKQIWEQQGGAPNKQFNLPIYFTTPMVETAEVYPDGTRAMKQVFFSSFAQIKDIVDKLPEDKKQKAQVNVDDFVNITSLIENEPENIYAIYPNQNFFELKERMTN